VSTEQRVLFLCQIGAGKTLEVNPVGGDLSLSKIYAAGQIMNVYGDHKLTINDWYAGTNSANAPSTIYVANAAHVVVTNWRAGTSSSHPLQTVNVVNSGGQVDIQQVSGLSHWVKQGSGKMVYGGNAGTSGDAAYITAEAGTLIVSNFTAVASEVTATNMTLTNSATLVMKSPATFRRVSIAQNSVVEMDVLSNSEAAHLGVVPSSENSQHQFNCLDGSHTLKLKYTTGFDPTDDAEWIVYVGRRKSSSGGSMSSTETGRITVDTSDLVSHGATGTFSSPTLCPNSNGAANTAIKITYTKPATAPELSNPTATVTGTTTATLGATVDRNNGLSITDYGIVYSKTATEPTVGGSGCTKAQKGTTTPTSGAAWTLNVTGLEAGTTYYYRGYATSSAGTGYSTVGTFTTLANQSTAVSVTVLTHTYNGNSITLVGTGGNGTGTAVYTFGTTLKTGTTGTGSLTSAGVLTVTAAGDFVFDVTRAASTGYAARTDEVTVTVGPGAQEISGLTTPINKTYGDANFTLGATGVATVGGATVTAAGSVTYVSSDEDVATIDGRTVHIVGAGTCTITASAGSTALYAAAADATATLNVAKKNPTVSASVSPASIRVGGTATLSGSTDSGATLTYSTSSSSIASLSGSAAGSRTVTGVAYGSATLTVNSPATANYNAGSETCTITVLLNAPTTQPAIEAVSVQANQFGVKTTGKGDAGAVLTLVKAGSAPTTPEDGTPWTTVANSGSLAWSSAAAYPSGATDGTRVIINSTGATFPQTRTITGASANTHYYVTAYGFNHSGNLSGSNGSYAFLVPGTTIDFWTLASEPTAAPTIGTIVEGGHGASIPVTAGAGGDGVLVLVKTGSSTTVTPTDGTTYAAGSTLSGWTVAYSGPSGTATASGLSSLTTYQVKAFTYSLNGGGVPNYYTGAFASTTLTTTDTSGPTTWATGVDATSFLLNWSKVTGDTTGYDIQTGSGAPVVLLDEGFTTSEGWLTADAASGTKTAASGAWTLSTCAITATASDGTSCANPAYGTSTAGLQFPDLTGTITAIKVQLGATANNTGTTKGLYLQRYSGSSWSTVATFSGTFSSASDIRWFTYTPSSPIAASGEKFRLYHYNGNTVYIYHVRVEGSVVSGVEGYSKVIDGLTSGTAYTAQVRKNPDGDWSDSLSVKAGVVPNTPSGSAVRNAVTFTWTDAQSGAAGYIVDATTTAAGWANKTCPAAALTLGSFGSGQDWKYTGTTATSTSGTVNSAPTYSTSGDDGHFLVGRAGNAIESKPFAIAGATGLKLTFTVEAWNLANATAKIEAGRVNAYYKMDDGEWCYFGTGLPSGTADNSSAAVTLPVPKGALDGDEIAFRLVAVNAEGAGESYLRGPYINNLKVESTSVGAGYYGANSLSDYPQTISSGTTSHKVGGLTAGQTVYFRVQALQGSAASPTAKSVWVEATGTASAYTAPGTPGSVEGTVTRNSMTVEWTAGDTTDFSKYVLEVSTSSSFPAGSTTSYDVTGGATSKALTGLSANTTYYFRVKAVGTDSQQSAWSSTGNATTDVFGGPVLLAADPIERHAFTANWTADAAATGGYQIEWTRCGGGAADTTVSTCNNGTLTVGGDSGWRYIRPAGSGYPKWAKGSANDTVGHNMIVGVSPANPSPAVASPDMDFSTYSGGYVEFSHWSRHATLIAPDAKVTLWYRTSADGSTWGAWTEGETTANLTSGSTIVTEQLPIPAGAAGQAHVQIKLSTEHSLPSGSGHASIVVDGDSTYTGPMIKDITVHGTSSGTPDYDTCAEGRSGIQNVAAGTTLKAFEGLAAGTPYYYHVRSVVSGSPTTYSDWSEGQVTTLAPMSPPEEVWAENIRQNHMTVAWSEAEGADAGTLYKYQVSGCSPASSPTVTAVSESPTNAELTVEAEWSYIGGGTLVGAETVTVGGSSIAKLSEENFVESTRECYPVWAGNKNSHPEHSLVLAGTNSPGLESTEFSTVGATAGSVSFGHGRWYAQDSTQGAATVLKLYYSIDGGDSWTLFQTTPNVYNKDYAYNNVVTYSLPAAALGHAHAKVRLVAEAATVAATTSGGSTYHALGAAVTAAKVTLTKPTGNYTGGGCVITSGEGLTADQLSAELSGLTANSTYYFRVAASDGVLVGGSAQYGAWVESMAKTLAVPAAPASAWVVPESIGRHSMTIQWDVAEGAETYEVKVYKGSSASGTLKQTLTTDGTTLMVSGLEAQTQYYFTVRAKADNEQSSSTANCTGTTSDSLKITGFCVTNILENTLTVKWDDEDAAYTLEVGSTSTSGSSEPVYETIACPATTLARSDAGNGWFYLGGNANYPKYYVKSSGTAAEKAADQGHVLSYSSGGTPGIQSRWFSTYGAKSAAVEFLHGRWYNGGANSALRVMYSIDGGTTWTSAGDIPASNESVPGGSSKTVTRLELPARALGQRSVAIRLLAPNATSGGSYGYGAEVKDLTIKIESYPNAANVFSGSVDDGSKNLSGLTAGQRYWFRLTASETFEGTTYTATAEQTAATRKKTTGVVQSQGFEGSGGALDTTAWGYDIKYITVGSTTPHAWTSGDPKVEVVDGENPLYGDKALRMSGSASAGTFGVAEFRNKTFASTEKIAVTIPFAARGLSSGENLWVSYSTDGGSTWVAPAGLTTAGSGTWIRGKIATGGSDVINQNWPYNHGTNGTTRPAGDAYTFELDGVSQIAVRVAFCGNSGGAAHYYYIDEVKLERLAQKPKDATATANSQGTVDLAWTPPDGQSVVIIRGQDKRYPPSSVDLDSLPHGYEVVKTSTGGNYWVNTASSVPALSKTAEDTGVTGGWKYFYYFYGALDNGDGTYSLSRDCLQREAIVKGMVEAIASQGWDGWDVHPWGYKKGRTTNPGQAGDCGYWAYNQSGATLPYKWAHFVENSWEYDGDARVEPTGVSTYASWYGSGCTYGPAGRNDPDRTNQLGVSSFTNYFGTNCFRLSGGSGWVWSGEHTYTNNNGNVRTVTDPYINTNNAAIQFDTVDLSGYKNVEFSFHYAQTYSGGGNYMHVAISTNGNGENGSWMAYDNKDPSGWRQVDSSRDYGLQLQTMTEDQTDGSVNFYDESRAPYGNPFVLQVPDSVTQMTVRLTFFDTTGKDQRKALVFVDEVRLTGEVAIEAPKPYISEIGKDQFMVHWAAVEDATTYDVQVTEECDENVVKLQQAFPVNALPKGWTKSSGGVEFQKAASRLYSGASSDHDFGLALTAAGSSTESWLVSPEVGGTTNLHFFAKAKNASGSAKLIVEAKGDKDTVWEEIGTWTAAQLTDDWKGYTNSLPNRQWTQVRFRREGGSAQTDNIYVDDITIHGVGVYTDASKVKLDVTGVSATNRVVTGLTSGKRYLAHVRAVGSPAGVVVRSAWGETADWTSGDFQALADGYEMTHLTWAAAGGGMVVVAVDKGTDPSAVKAPTNTLANYQTLAGTYGAFDEGRSTGAHVIWAGTTAQTAPGKEFVSPYDEDHPAADFVVYWKRGNYWEGRLATNVALGTYMCAAADAFAVTNGTALTAGAQGAGWDGNWQAWEDGASYISVIDGSLIGSNKLAGAGGNMVRYTMEDGSRYLRIYRPLETALSSSEVWIMATFRSRYGMDPSNPGEAKAVSVQLSDAKDNPSGGVYAGDDTHVFAQFGKKASTDRHLKIWNSGGTADSSYTFDDWGHTSSSGIYTMVAKYTRGDGNLRVKVYYNGGSGTISGGDGELRPTAPEPGNATFHVTNNVGTHNVASIFLMGSGYHGYLDFDEVRVGTSWADIVGKETEAPFPVTSARAWTDGNELVRIDWTYADAGTDTSVTPNLERPLAAGVRVIAKTGTGAWTAEELALAAHPAGTTAGDAVVIYEGKGTNEAAVAAGGISRWDHVVAPGSIHRYAVAAYTGGKNAAAVEAVDRDNPGVYTETTGLYGETEYLNPFAYTNWSVASTTDGKRWLGGNGFGENYWTPGGAGVWSIATPEEAQAAVHITNVVNGSRMAAGNVLKVVLGDYETADIYRTLGGDAWCGKGGQTFYVAFRMAYQYGNGAGRQVGLRLTDSTGTYVQFGKARGDGEGFQNHFGINAKPYGDPSADYGTGWSNGGNAADDIRGYYDADADAAFLVVAKVNWSADNKANLRAVHYGIGTNGTPATLPAEEKDVTWEASYDNAAIQAISKIELIAGTKPSSEGGYGQIGTAWFDEIRFGTSWEDIVGATEPEDAWVDGIGVVGEGGADATYRYLGDYVQWYMYGWPKGPKQSAWVTLATDNTFATVLATNGTSWVTNTVDNRDGTGRLQTKWQGGEVQFTRTGNVYAGGSVKGELVTLHSWQRPEPYASYGHKWNVYNVRPLPKPVTNATSAVGGTAKVTLRWSPATENGRTFTEVMVVRYTGDGAAPAPVQGTTYLKGQRIGSGTVVYRGTATNLVDKGLNKDTTFHYQFFTVNNSYYSEAETADATTDENDPEILIDGDPTDWVGEPSETKNSSALSSGEWIWTDKVLDGRVDKNGAYDADITEFRMKVDTNKYVNFMVRLHCMTNKQNPYISVGIVTNVDATTNYLAVTNADGENWIGDESATFMGGNLFSPASLHYADIQMAVHWVTTAGEDGEATGTGGWVVELYRKDRNSWYAPVAAWEAESSDNGAADPCIEWKVKRSDLGLDYATVTPARFTVASFANGGGWNNDTQATVDLSSGTSHAVDTLAIAPWGVNDKALALTAWDEGIQNKNAEYWFDIWFGPSALHNAAPNAPETYTLDGSPAVNGQVVSASPTMRWNACTDATNNGCGFVVGYLVEVSTNEYFNGLEGTTENGPISCRVNLEGATNTSYRYKTDSRYYWWRVRARDNSGALSAPTPWSYEVTGKTDNEGPVARLLFVGKDAEVARYVSDAAFRHEQDMSGDGKSVLDSDLEDGGHTFGFVIEWYDVNGVFATNWYRASQTGDPSWPKGVGKNPYDPEADYDPHVGDFAWNVYAEHGDDPDTPFGRVSPNWDLLIVDRSTVGKDSPTLAKESVNGKDYNYEKRTDLVLPTDDGGTETLEKVWVIDCGLDRVFQPGGTINTGNDGQYVTNHVQGAFAIGTYRTDLDIYLTVSAEDGCRFGADPYSETADYDWPLYSESGDTGSYKGQDTPTWVLSGWCAAAPNPSHNVTTNQLLHIHVRDNDDQPPVTSQAKWRTDATGAGGKVLLPMMAVTSGGDADAPGSWDPTWDNLAAQGRVPTQDGQGKALEWQLTDGDVSSYTPPATAGGTGTQSWKGSAKPIRLFFNVYDEYLHSGLASFTAYNASNAPPTKTDGAAVTGSYVSQAAKTRTLYNTLLMLGTETNVAGYRPAWSKITQYPWEELSGVNTHGWGTGPDSVLAWQLDASEANVTNLFGRHDILSALGSGFDTNGAIVFTNDVKLLAWDNDNNAEGDQEGEELTFGRVLFSDDDATPPEMPGFAAHGTGTNFTWFGELAKWTWATNESSGEVPVCTVINKRWNIQTSTNVFGKKSSTSRTPESDTDEEVKWNINKKLIYMQGNMNATEYRAANSKYFQFQVGGNGDTTWRSDMIGFWSRVSPTGPTKFTLTVQGSAGTAYPAVIGRAWALDGQGAPYWTTDYCTVTNEKVGTYDNVVIMRQGTGNGASATVTSKSINCSDIANLTIDFDAGIWGGTAGGRALYVEYNPSGDPGWKTVKTFDGSAYGDDDDHFTATAGNGGWKHYSYNFAAIDGLLQTSQTVAIRLRATTLTAARGFVVSELKLTAGGDESSERWLGDIVIEKQIATNTVTTAGEEQEAGSYANTETSVILGFDGLVEGYDNSMQTFRLYGYGATHLNANTGEIDYNTPNGTWGIKDLFIHGTASEVTPDLVTDYDITHGTWTNQLEAVDGAMGGYDTVQSGLRMFDATNAAGTKTEVTGEAPAFRILYPTHYDGTTNAYPNGTSETVTSGDIVLEAVAKASYAKNDDPDFLDAEGWSLANGASIAGGVLTLPDNDAVSSASRVFTVTPPEDLAGVTFAGTISAKAAKKPADGGTNTLWVTVQPCSDNAGATTLGRPMVQELTLTTYQRWKNYAVGPWPEPLTSVRSVVVSVAQSNATSTEMLVDSLDVYVAQWGTEITTNAADAAAWAANVTNGMPGARIVMGTPTIDLSTTAVPIFNPNEAHTQLRHYRLETTLHDYDTDRAGDALGASAVTNFWLYDDDQDEPKWGSKYGGPLGVFLNEAIVPQAWRTGIDETTNDNSRLNQRWPIVDSELTALAPGDPVKFALSFYDYSGWWVSNLTLGAKTLVANGAVSAAGWTAPAENDGAADSPGAMSYWTIGAKDLYDEYKESFDDTSSDTGEEMKALVWDKDRDRADDAMSFDDRGAPKRVGYVWFTDQDVTAPAWGTQAAPYSGIMISTNLPNTAAGYAAMLAQTAESAPYAVGGWTNNTLTEADWKTPNFARSYVIYDGELHTNVASSSQFVITANINDPADGYRAHKAAGLQRGSTLTNKLAMWGDDPASPADAANVFIITNTYVVLTNASAGTALTNAAYNSVFSEPVSKTRVALQAGHTSWTWSNFHTNDIGLMLPAGETESSVGVVIEAFDADLNRHNDQKHVTLSGPTITLKDDDTKEPGQPGVVSLTGLVVPTETLVRTNAPWTNNLSGVKMSFGAAGDPLKVGDLNASGVARYRLAAPGTTIAVGVGDVVVPDEDVVVETAETRYSDISVPNLTASQQGWGEYRLFAEDKDDDRPADALAGTWRGVPLAYDITLPTKIGSAAGEDYRLKADPDNTDDPTTQFDLTWPIGGVGPDDPADTTHYNAIPQKYKDEKVSNVEILSPWYSYKIYYGTFSEADVPADDDPSSDTKSYIYTTYVANGAYKSWASVDVSTNAAADPSAPANPYASLGAVAETTGLSGKQRVRLYDLDFDQHYAVVIVGVDKAGNEGPAGQWSWATNNTIKFALTQGVVRASSAINQEIGVESGTNTVGMAPITGPGAPGKAAVLHWMAAGMKDRVRTNETSGAVTTNLEGNVSKYYDLLYRDARSFNELGTEQWKLAGADGANSGVSKTNWNYQADAGLGTPNRLRFFRASYHDRWQDAVTNAGVVKSQRPLASEEVYSMNNVVLSEGFNWVSLQGVPYTNTFRAVFGTDTGMWPSGGVTPTIATNGAVVVQFYKPGKSSEPDDWYFFSGGEWYSQAGGAPVTDDVQADGFFSRPFSISLPYSDDDTNEAWWNGHGDYEGATYGSKKLKAMLWHPILQVPTNMAVTVDRPASGAAAGTRTEKRVELHLPRDVHPDMLNLTGFAKGDGEETRDRLTVVAAGGSTRGTLHCTADGEWQDSTGAAVTATNYIHADDTLVFESVAVEGESDWEWECPTVIQTVNGTKGTYNLLSLNLPVAVHPSRLGLSGINRNDEPRDADKLYVVDTATKQVRRNSMMYCDTGGDWHLVTGGPVPSGFIQPNDMLVLISAGGSDWTWSYCPDQFYTRPNRHMGRPPAP
jgi:hypothetical protein